MNQKWTRIKILRFAFSVSPVDFCVFLIAGLLKCAVSASGIFLTRSLFVAIENAILDGVTAKVYPWFLIYAAYLLVLSAFPYVFTRYIVQFKMLPHFEHLMLKKIHKKAQLISSEQMQTPDIERLIRQANGARQALFRYEEICITIAINIIQTIVVTLTISSLNAWYLFFMPLALIASLIRHWQKSKLINESLRKAAQLKREEASYEKALLDETANKETRVCNAEKILLKKWTDSRKARDTIDDNISRKLSNIRWYLLPIELIGKIAGILVSSVLLLNKIISFSIFTAGVSAYETLLGSYEQLLEMIGNQKQYYTMLQPFFQYWSYPERNQNSASNINDTTIELRNVSFRYPRQKNFAIHNINLTLHQGEILAIVGENGAGKTTLARLITGLYMPTEGNILYGNNDIAAIGERQLHKLQSIVDQNFCRYKLSAEKNITLGDPEKQVDKAFIKNRLSEIINSSETDTQLGREFGGIDLSGGQWQRLACERGFYKNSRIMSLDEATSSIDALQEKRMYDDFAINLEGKTGIIITHRLGAVRLSDLIVVLSHGEIAETGTHKELIDKKGLYYAMWQSQAEQYV